MAYSLLASGKRIGMSFEEINFFSMAEYYEFLEYYLGSDTGEKQRRVATQEDIDRMYK